MADISKIELPSGDIYNIKDEYARNSIVYTEEASGDLVTFSDGANNFPVSELIVGIDPMQPGSGNPSSNNIRTIFGWNSISIRCTGKNLWGGDALIADIKDAISTATIDNENRTITFASTATVVVPFCGLRGGRWRGFQFEENKRYTFVFTIYKTSGTGSNIIIHYTDGTNEKPATSATTTKETLVIVSNEEKTVQDVSKNTQSGNTVVYADECGIFEGVLTADDFEAYNGTSKTIEFPQEVGTVYGGTLNVTTGQLTVTHGVISSYNGETLTGEWISDRDVYSPNTTPTTGAQVVYELSTPLVYQITPVQISSLTGITTIYANAGSIQKVVYARDTFDPIAQLISNKVSDNSYSLSISGGRITLTSSSGETSYVDLPVYDGTVV